MKNLISKLRSFSRADEGVVSVEWVSLAAALVVGAITVGLLVTNGAAETGKNVPGDVNQAVTDQLASGKYPNIGAPPAGN